MPARAVRIVLRASSKLIAIILLLVGTHAAQADDASAPGTLTDRAGSESGAAVWSNDIAPDRAAAALRGEPV